MALDFGIYTDVRYVDHGTLGSWAMSVGTILVWIWMENDRSDVAPPGICGKRTATETHFFGINFADSNDLRYRHDRATTRLDIVGTDELLVDEWSFVGVSFDTAGVDGDQHLYHGTLTKLVAETGYAAQQVGTGAIQDLTGNTFYGGWQGQIADGYWDGKVAWIAAWTRQLSLGEIKAQQFRPHVTSGCLLFSHYHGTGTQPDLSGNGNNGTVTGALVTNHVPLAPPFGFDIAAIGAGGRLPLLFANGLGGNMLGGNCNLMG